jgi:hypothetical protein
LVDVVNQGLPLGLPLAPKGLFRLVVAVVVALAVALLVPLRPRLLNGLFQPLLPLGIGPFSGLLVRRLLALLRLVLFMALGWIGGAVGQRRVWLRRNGIDLNGLGRTLRLVGVQYRPSCDRPVREVSLILHAYLFSGDA